MPSQTDTTLHIDGLTWALRRLGAGCVGKLSAVAPSAKSQMSRGGSRWLPVSLVSPQRSLEVAWGTHNRPRTSSVPPTYVLPSTTLCFTEQGIECVHLLSFSWQFNSIHVCTMLWAVIKLQLPPITTTLIKYVLYCFWIVYWVGYLLVKLTEGRQRRKKSTVYKTSTGSLTSQGKFKLVN